MWLAVLSLTRNRVFSYSASASTLCASPTLLRPLANLTAPHPSTLYHHQHSPNAKLLYSMDIAYFRLKPDDNQVQINFHYRNADQQIDRVFNLSRSVSETVNTCMQRIQANVQKELQKRARRAKGNKRQQDPITELSSSALPDVELREAASAQQLGDLSILEVLHNRAAGFAGNLQLNVFGSQYRVAFNLPWVHAITIPTSIMAGYFVYPSKLELDGCTMHDVDIEWFAKNGTDADDVDGWRLVGNAYQWLVTDDCIGHELKVRCTPRNGPLAGPALEACSKTPVQSGPSGVCHYVDRHRYTTAALGPEAFRIVSFNLLADLYADSDYSRAELFPYIPAAALHIDYRKQLFVRELLGYRADVLCLQEVDAKIFDYDLVPVLGYAGYAGSFQRKGQTAEGVAMFYDRKRFDLIETSGINIGESLGQLDCLYDLWTAISTNAALAERIRVRSTAVQVCVLRSREQPNKWLCVANTHLYFHPDADHIRLLQAAAAFRYVQDVRARILREHASQIRAEADVSILFCGDFNSTPECGVFRLMTERFVPADFVDFRSNTTEAIDCLSLKQPFQMRSAYESIKYTNYTVGFTECIDYIFYQSDDLRIRQTVPPPSDEQLAEHVAIPSVLHPSDHVALIADIEWRSL